AGADGGAGGRRARHGINHAGGRGGGAADGPGEGDRGGAGRRGGDVRVAAERGGRGGVRRDAGGLLQRRRVVRGLRADDRRGGRGTARAGGGGAPAACRGGRYEPAGSVTQSGRGDGRAALGAARGGQAAEVVPARLAGVVRLDAAPRTGDPERKDRGDGQVPEQDGQQSVRRHGSNEERRPRRVEDEHGADGGDGDGTRAGH